MQNWKQLGNCVGKDPDLFFPEKDRWAEVRAKRICAGCLVRAQCLDYALENCEVGIWGETSERDRKWIQARYRRGAKALAVENTAVV